MDYIESYSLSILISEKFCRKTGGQTWRMSNKYTITYIQERQKISRYSLFHISNLDLHISSRTKNKEGIRYRNSNYLQDFSLLSCTGDLDTINRGIMFKKLHYKLHTPSYKIWCLGVSDDVLTSRQKLFFYILQGDLCSKV